MPISMSQGGVARTLRLNPPRDIPAKLEMWSGQISTKFIVTTFMFKVKVAPPQTIRMVSTAALQDILVFHFYIKSTIKNDGGYLKFYLPVLLLLYQTREGFHSAPKHLNRNKQNSTTDYHQGQSMQRARNNMWAGIH